MNLNEPHHKVLILLTAYLTALLLLAVLVWRASPAPASQVIRGVSISTARQLNDSGEHIYSTNRLDIGGRRLRCTVIDQTPPATSDCTIRLAGKTLTVRARRNPPENMNQLGGTCEAFYAEETWPCQIGSPHVHVHWFAYVNRPFELTPNQLTWLRLQFFVENLPETVILVSVLVAGLPLALLAMIFLCLWRWSAGNRIALVLVSLPAGFVVWCLSTVIALLLTNGFWD